MKVESFAEIHDARNRAANHQFRRQSSLRYQLAEITSQVRALQRNSINNTQSGIVNSGTAENSTLHVESGTLVVASDMYVMNSGEILRGKVRMLDEDGSPKRVSPTNTYDIDKLQFERLDGRKALIHAGVTTVGELSFLIKNNLLSDLSGIGEVKAPRIRAKLEQYLNSLASETI